MTHDVLVNIITWRKMNKKEAKEIFLNNYLVLNWYDDEILTKQYGVPEDKLEAFKIYFKSCYGTMDEVLKDIVENFKADVDDDE